MFSWFLDRRNPNDNYHQSNGQSGPVPVQVQPSTSLGLKIEKPSFNSVRIEGSKQNIIGNQTSQKHIFQQHQANTTPKDPFFDFQFQKPKEGDDFSVQRNNFIFDHYKTFNETNLFDLGIDITSSGPIFPNLQSIVSDLPLGEKSFYQNPEEYQRIDYNAFQANEEIFIKSASDECLLFIFYSKPRTISQKYASDELINRKFVYINDMKQWKNEQGLLFNPKKWIFEDPSKR